MKLKPIVLCADDYGQEAAISQGIVALLEQGRLSAASCMVNSPSWPEQAKWLKPFQAQVDIGMHFNLTAGQALSNAKPLFSLPTLMLKAFTRQLNPAAIEAEFQAQLDSFIAAMNCLPHFIDGHQHVHQLPVVREAVLKVYQQRLCLHKSYIRWINAKINLMDFKKQIIHISGTRAFKKLLVQQAVPHNLSFSGIYPFAEAEAYGDWFPRFLAESGPQGLIMCHAGLASSSAHDAIAKARHHEYLYFSSKQFLQDCHEHHVVIGRGEYRSF